MSKTKSRLILLTGLLLILASVLLYLEPWQGLLDAETRAWRLTLVGRDGTKKILSFRDVTALPTSSGNGGFFSTVGVIYGPSGVRGVTLQELCGLVGGIEPGDAVLISARDGYSTVLSYEQVLGDFAAYTKDLKEVPPVAMKTMLIYDLDGRSLSAEDGKPLRLAVVASTGGLLTEGNYWVKWVNKVEVLRAS